MLELHKQVFQQYTHVENDSLIAVMSNQQELEEFNLENEKRSQLEENQIKDLKFKQNRDEISVGGIKQIQNQSQNDRERQEPLLDIDLLDEHQQMAEISNQVKINAGIKEKPHEIDGLPLVHLKNKETDECEDHPKQQNEIINQIEFREEQNKLNEQKNQKENQFNEFNFIQGGQLDNVIQNQAQEINIVEQLNLPKPNSVQVKDNFEDVKLHFLRQDDRINQVLDAMKLMQIEIRNLQPKQKANRQTKQKDSNLDQYIPQKMICLKNIDDSQQNSSGLSKQLEKEDEQQSSNRKRTVKHQKVNQQLVNALCLEQQNEMKKHQEITKQIKLSTLGYLENGSIKCKLCNSQYKRQQDLVNHWKKKHQPELLEILPNYQI